MPASPRFPLRLGYQPARDLVHAARMDMLDLLPLLAATAARPG